MTAAEVRPRGARAFLRATTSWGGPVPNNLSKYCESPAQTSPRSGNTAAPPTASAGVAQGRRGGRRASITDRRHRRSDCVWIRWWQQQQLRHQLQLYQLNALAPADGRTEANAGLAGS